MFCSSFLKAIAGVTAEETGRTTEVTARTVLQRGHYTGVRVNSHNYYFDPSVAAFYLRVAQPQHHQAPQPMA